jgi:DNA-binding response OmpR family regulator
MSSAIASFVVKVGDSSAVASRHGAGLTRKEAQLLAVLRENPGRCLSRKWLLQVVWGYGPEVRTRTVDVHIRKLRRKLAPEEARHIRTVVRQGYCWDPALIAPDSKS